SARNAGLKLVNGKYICFLDSDDIMLEDNLKLKIQYAEQKNLKLIFSDFCQLSEMDNFNNPNKHKAFLREYGYIDLIAANIPKYIRDGICYILPKDYFLKVAVKNMGINTNTIFIDSDFLFNEVRASFDTDLKSAEDLDMWRKLIFNKNLSEIGYLDTPLSIYRFYNAHWMQDPQKEYFLYRWLKRFINDLKKYKDVIGNQYLAEEIWNMLWWFKQNKGYKFFFFGEIFLLYPWKLKYWRNFFHLLITIRPKTS
ncbi:unnamed protein product, partial [marine sediment metagenome]